MRRERGITLMQPDKQVVNPFITICSVSTDRKTLALNSFGVTHIGVGSPFSLRGGE